MKPATSAATKLSRFHFIIATLFEGGKYLHQTALYFALDHVEYGIIGSVFSVAYLSANLAGLEGGNALVPHAGIISTNKKRWHFIAHTLIAPQLIQHSVAAIAAWYTIYQLTHQELLATAGSLTALSEGLRIAFRPLIYAITDSKRTAKYEAAIAFAYIGSIWLMTTYSNSLLTSSNIVALYPIASLCGLFYLVGAGAAALLRIHPSNIEALPSQRAIWRMQGMLLALHLPHNLFSANFMVPFFAYRSGMSVAGAIKITSEIAGAVRAIIKSSIGLPLNALFNQLSSGPVAASGERQKIFTAIHLATARAAGALLAIIGTIAATFVMPWQLHTQVLFAGFCLLMIADYLCMPYEMLSLHTGTVARAALIRGAEVVVDGGILIACGQWPVLVIVALGGVRFGAWQFLMRVTRPRPFF